MLTQRDGDLMSKLNQLSAREEHDQLQSQNLNKS